MMKKQFVQTGSLLAACAFAAGTALAQQATVGQTEVTTTETRTTVATPTVAVTPTVTTTTATPTVLRLGQLQARDISGQSIGTIEDVVVSPQGCLDMAVLSMGGTRLVPVPWQVVRTESVAGGTAVGATAVPGPAFVTLQVDSARLQQAPSIDRAQLRTQLSQPAFAQQVNTFFGVQAGATAGFTSTTNPTNVTTGRIGDTNQFGIGRTNLFPTGRTNVIPGTPNAFPPTQTIPPGTPSTTPTPSVPDLNNPGARPTIPPRTSTPGTVTPGTAPAFPTSPATPRPPTTPSSPTLPPPPSSPSVPRTPNTTP